MGEGGQDHGQLPIDTIWDAANVLYDIGKIGVGYATGNTAMMVDGSKDLAMETGALLIPYVPAGASKVLKVGIKYGDEAAESIKAFDKANDARKAAEAAAEAKKAADAADAAKKATDATKAARGEVNVYRAFGGDARAQGFSWTTRDPRTVSNFRDAAGLPSGGPSGATNTADFMVTGKANVSDIIKSRTALPLDGNRGGLPELIIDPKNVEITDFAVLKP